MNLQIKRLAPGDEAVLARVEKDVFDEAVDATYLNAYLAEPHQHMIVALEEGAVVGQIRAVLYKHPDKADELFIENLGVTPALRRQGIATRLLKTMLELGRDLGCKEAWVATESDNTRARTFYESFGVEAEAGVVYSFNL